MIETESRETHLNHSWVTWKPLVIDQEAVKFDPKRVILPISPSKPSSHCRWLLEAQIAHKIIGMKDVIQVNVIQGFVLHIENGVKITTKSPRKPHFPLNCLLTPPGKPSCTRAY